MNIRLAAPRSSRSLAFRTALALGIVAISLACIAATFWHEDWRYSLPTARPPGLVQAAEMTRVAQPTGLEQALSAARGKPVLVHVFNPTCPCSRFNLDHLRELIRDFGPRLAILVVLEGTDREELESAFAGLHVGGDHVVDLDGSIAAALGVYATPQAVVLDGSRRVYFRGNYNTSRYCTARATQFARRALEALFEGRASPDFGPEATVEWGCALPSAGDA